MGIEGVFDWDRHGIGFDRLVLYHQPIESESNPNVVDSSKDHVLKRVGFLAIHRKVYRFRMEPKRSQESSLNRMAGARRWVWNWGLSRCKATFETTRKSITPKQLSAELTALKRNPETAWLNQIDAQLLQQALKDLQRGFANLFAKRARYPRFKSRKRDPLRFRIPQRVKIAGGKVYVPKIGWIPVRLSREIDGTTKSATFRRDAAGRWHVGLTVEFEMPDVPLLPPDPLKVAGIDLGLKTFAVTSDGAEVASPKFYRKGQRKLRKAQRSLSRRQPGSRRKAKARLKLARIHQRIAHQRGDFLHKLTTKLVNGHDGLCIEDLSLKGFAKTKLAKSFSDAAMGEFRRQLTYKSEWNRKHLIVIDRFFPSSRLCRGCGLVNAELTLSDRQWVCECGMVHDRDRSAAINIRDEGLRTLAVGSTDKSNARGAGVRPPMEAVGVEPRIPRL